MKFVLEISFAERVLMTRRNGFLFRVERFAEGVFRHTLTWWFQDLCLFHVHLFDVFMRDIRFSVVLRFV